MNMKSIYKRTTLADAHVRTPRYTHALLPTHTHTHAHAHVHMHTDVRSNAINASLQTALVLWSMRTGATQWRRLAESQLLTRANARAANHEIASCPGIDSLYLGEARPRHCISGDKPARAWILYNDCVTVYRWPPHKPAVRINMSGAAQQVAGALYRERQQ